MTSRTDGNPDLQLGLIGDHISRSRSPMLHRLAGAQNGLLVDYARLIPVDLEQSFASVLESCATRRFRGVNVTYPYKELAASLVESDDPQVRGIGAVNTILFQPEGPKGFNTDYSGFIEAYRASRGNAPPGDVLMIGAGGVGRAIAFSLVALGVTGLRLVDRDSAKSDALVEDLRAVSPDTEFSVWIEAVSAAKGASGLVNCTPVGMVGHDGTPLARSAMTGAEWAFDAVYTPADTQFLVDAEAEGLKVISGWELFFRQGVGAWRLFSGLTVNAAALRHELLTRGEAE